MIKVGSYDQLKYSKMKKSMLRFKDYGTLEFTLDSQLYATTFNYLNKLYKLKSIGLYGARFMKQLNGLDREYATKTINRRVKGIDSELEFYGYDNKFILTTEVSFENHKFIIDRLNSKFDTKYYHSVDLYDNYTSYMSWDSSNNKGVLITVNMVLDEVVVYDTALDGEVLLFNRNAVLRLNDEDLESILGGLLDMVDLMDTKSYFEGKMDNRVSKKDYNKLFKSLEISDGSRQADDVARCVSIRLMEKSSNFTIVMAYPFYEDIIKKF